MEVARLRRRISAAGSKARAALGQKRPIGELAAGVGLASAWASGAAGWVAVWVGLGGGGVAVGLAVAVAVAVAVGVELAVGWAVPRVAVGKMNSEPIWVCPGTGETRLCGVP